MKKILLFVLTALMFTACDNSGKNQPEPSVLQDSVLHYIGSTFVEYEEEVYETPGVKVDVVRCGDDYATLKLYQVKFVPQMPVSVDLEVDSLDCQTSASVITFTGNGIVPTMGGNPVTRYIATRISGKVDADSLHFSLHFGPYPTTYAGARLP